MILDRISRDRKFAFMSGMDGAICVWDIDGGAFVHKVKTNVEHLGAMILLKEEMGVVTSCDSACLLVWKIANQHAPGQSGTSKENDNLHGRDQWQIDAHCRLSCVARSDDGLTVATGYDIGSFQMWNYTSLGPIGDVQAVHTKSVTHMVFSIDCTKIICASEDGSIQVRQVDLRSICRAHESCIASTFE